MYFINRLSKFYKAFFPFMWMVLKGPLSYSFSLTFDRSSYSSIVNALGALSFLFTIPYTVMIGLPVGVAGLVLGALSAPFAYFIAGVIELGAKFFPDFEGRSDLKIRDLSEAKMPELNLEDLMVIESTASISYKQGVYYFDELKESQKTRGAVNSDAYTDSEIALSRKAKSFLNDASKGYQILSNQHNSFFSDAQRAEDKFKDCNTKIGTLHF